MARRRKGISEAISAVLLIGISAALGSMLFVYFTNALFLQQSSFQEQVEIGIKRALTGVRVTWHIYNSSGLYLYVFNYGETDVTLSSVYIDMNRYVPSHREIPSGSVRLIYVDVTLSPGTHDLRIVTEDGAYYETELRIG